PGKEFLIDVPAFKDFEDRAGRKTRAQEHAKHARRLTLVLRFLQTLAIQKLSCQLLFINLFIRGVDRTLDYLAVYALCFEISDHASTSELFIALPILGISCSVA